jgi:hypothetical protein
MATSSILGGQRPATQPAGTGIDALGPSDSSDSGSDVVHERRMPTEADNAGELGAVPSHPDSTTDAAGTGERASAEGNAEGEPGADLLPDASFDVDELAADEDDATGDEDDDADAR